MSASKRYITPVILGAVIIAGGFVAMNGTNLLSQPVKGFTCPSASELKENVAASLCNKLTTKYANDTASITWLNAVKNQFARAEEKKRSENLLVAAAMFSYMKAGAEKAIYLKNNPIDEEGDTLKEIDEIGSSPDVISTCKNGETKTVTTTTNCGCDEIHTCSEGVWKKTSETACRPCIAPRDEKITGVPVDGAAATADTNPGAFKSIQDISKLQDLTYTVTTSPKEVKLPSEYDMQFLTTPLKVNVAITKTPKIGIKSVIIRGYDRNTNIANVLKDAPIESYTLATNTTNTYTESLKQISKYKSFIQLFVFIETNDGTIYTKMLEDTQLAAPLTNWRPWTHGEGCTRTFSNGTVTLITGKEIGKPLLSSSPYGSIAQTKTTDSKGNCTRGPDIYCQQGYLNGSDKLAPIAHLSNEEIAEKGLKFGTCDINDDLSCNVYTKDTDPAYDASNKIAFTVANGKTHSYFPRYTGTFSNIAPKKPIFERGSLAEKNYNEMMQDYKVGSKESSCIAISKKCSNGRWELDENYRDTVWAGYKSCLQIDEVSQGNINNLPNCDNNDKLSITHNANISSEVAKKIQSLCNDKNFKCFDMSKTDAVNLPGAYYPAREYQFDISCKFIN